MLAEEQADESSALTRSFSPRGSIAAGGGVCQVEIHGAHAPADRWLFDFPDDCGTNTLAVRCPPTAAHWGYKGYAVAGCAARRWTRVPAAIRFGGTMSKWKNEEIIRVRMDERQRRKIDRAAARAGTTRSALIRAAVNLLLGPVRRAGVSGSRPRTR